MSGAGKAAPGRGSGGGAGGPRRFLALLRLLLWLAGVGLAAALVGRHAETVGAALARVGWGFAAYLCVSWGVYLLGARAWEVVLRAVPGDPERVGPFPGFGRLFAIRMAGEALNKVTPFASLGGEPVKAYLLAREGAALRDALASVAVAKQAMTLAQIAFVFVGLALAAALLPEQRELLVAAALFPALVLGLMIGTAALDHRLRRSPAAGRSEQPQGARREPHGGAGATGRAWRERALALWAQTAEFFWAQPRALLLSFLLFFAGWAAGALEHLVAARLLGLPLSPAAAVAMEALLVSLNMATFLVPANLGVQEGGFALVAPLVGLSAPHGLALAVLRRCRDVVWIGFGLAYLAATGARGLRVDAESAPPPA